MKKTATILALGGLLLVLSLLSGQPRGDLYGGRALLSLEQAFKTTGVLTFPNYAAAPVVCNAANRGVYYYDTTLTDARVCGAAGWATIFGGFTVGTAATLPMWNGVPDDLVDSSFVNAGVPAAGAGGNIMTMYETVLAMDGNDTITGLDVQITNANHAGANNWLYGIHVWATIPDPQALEYGIGIGGWDTSLFGVSSVLTLGSELDVVSIVDFANAGAVFQFDTLAGAGASYTAAFFAPAFAIMDGADTSIGLYLAMTSADHTGGPNTNNLYGINIEDIVNDDDTVEYAIVTETGWDADIWNIDDDLYLGSVTQIVSVLDDTLGQIFTVDSAHAAGASNDWVEIVANVAIMDNNDTVRGLFIDIANPDHTGATNFLYGLDIDGIVGDANASEYAINIGDGWDRDIYSADDMYFATAAGSDDYYFYGGAAIKSFWYGNPNAGQFFFTFQSAGQLAGEGFMELGTTLGAMNGADTDQILFIDVGNADHTGGGNTLNILEIDAITGDANSYLNAIYVGALTGTAPAVAETEYAINIQGGWDHDIFFTDPGTLVTATGGSITLETLDAASSWHIEGGAGRTNGLMGSGTVLDIDHGVTSFMTLSTTLTANDNAGDQRNVLFLDTDIPNGTGGLITGIWIDEVVDDVDTIDSAIVVEGGWDSAITIFDRGGVATSNPLTGSIFIYLDDDADYSGGGGNDCALIARDNGGNNTVIATITLNGACP